MNCETEKGEGRKEARCKTQQPDMQSRATTSTEVVHRLTGFVNGRVTVHW